MALPRLNGTRIKGTEVPNYTWNADLISFDGPLLSLFKDHEGNDALFVWLDRDQKKNRWAIVEVTRDELHAYLRQQMTLRQIVQSTRAVITFDTSNGSRRSNFVKVHWGQLPAQYMPNDQSYLTDEIASAEAKAFVSEQVAEYTISLSGDDLYLEDLSGVPRLYQQLYSFHYGLEHLGRQAVRQTLSNRMRKWNGGFSAVHLFSGMRDVTPSIHRARLSNLYYNSPGHIKMELLPIMAERIKLVADEVRANLGDAETLYKTVYKFFKENRISGFEDERSKRANNLTAAQVRRLSAFRDEFIELLSWDDYKDKFVSLDVTPLAQLRAILAYYRRLRQILRYEERGIVTLT